MDECDCVPWRIPIREASDVGAARRYAREAAHRAGLAHTGAEALATAVSEVAQNIFLHALHGEIVMEVICEGSHRGVAVTARDDGPGIHDVAQAMCDGYSTTGTLGLGLSSAQRLMDEFQVDTSLGIGTTITMKKWCELKLGAGAAGLAPCGAPDAGAERAWRR